MAGWIRCAIVGGVARGADAERAARFREVAAVGQFRALWLAHAQSRIGDQLARVALSVLVYERTHSAAWTALTYAMTILPNLVGGTWLSGLADRFDRRTVMVVADATRAALVALMVLPGLPIVVLVVLLCLVQLPFAPFSAARNAVLPAVLDGDRYMVGLAVMRTTDQVGLVGGIAVAAALVTALGTSTTLLIDAATFAVSALVVGLGVRSHRPSGSAPSLARWSPSSTSTRRPRRRRLARGPSTLNDAEAGNIAAKGELLRVRTERGCRFVRLYRLN